MLSAIIPLDHMYVNVSLDILGVDKPAQLNFNFFVTIFIIVLHDTFDYSAAPSGCVARQLDSLLLMTR